MENTDHVPWQGSSWNEKSTPGSTASHEGIPVYRTTVILSNCSDGIDVPTMYFKPVHHQNMIYRYYSTKALKITGNLSKNDNNLAALWHRT